jgi:hypothetical protein
VGDLLFESGKLGDVLLPQLKDLDNLAAFVIGKDMLSRTGIPFEEFLDEPAVACSSTATDP